ncbi:MAG: flagellar motor protein MotB [Oscillospiraceae bacterium]|nr:flagellar motor protein MotB [Oscillospiraceae bacterium]
MARRKQAEESGGGSEWLNTYADMVTLLLTFFILLYSMSSLDSAKFNMMVKAFASSSSSSEQIILFSDGDTTGEGLVGGAPSDLPAESPEEANLDTIFQALTEYAESHSLEDSVNVSQGEGYVFVQFMDNMLFEPNSATLKTEHLEILNFVGMGIKSIQDQLKVIRIDGHTAAIPEVEDYPVSDWRLSADRANAVLIYFEENVGLDSSKMIQTGFGKQVPIVDNNDPALRSRNRRVEILISTESIIRDELNNIYENLRE